MKLDPATKLLDIWWKGVKVVDQLNTNFVPSAGRLVFGARTGGLNQVHHFDNVDLETFPVELASITKAQVGHNGLTVEITDYGTSSVVTPSDFTSLAIGGVVVTPNSLTKSNGITTVTYLPSPAFSPRQSISYEIIAQDQNSANIMGTGLLNAPVLPLDFFIDENPTLDLWNIREIRGGAVTASPTMMDSALAISANPPTAPVDYTAPYFNFSDDADFGSRGFFKRDSIYATSIAGNDDNVVGLGAVKIQVTQGGDQTFWVQSDDGFALRVNGSTFTKVAGLGMIDPSDSSTVTFLDGTGNSNTRALINLPVGEYVVEFIWFEGGGGSFAEVAWATGDHAADTTTGRWTLVGGSGETPIFPAAPLTEPAISGSNWAVRNYHNGGNVPTLLDAFAVIANPGNFTLTEVQSPVVNFRDPENPGADGIFRNNVPFPLESAVPMVDDNQFVTVGRYQFTATTAGDYSFAVTSDDGFAFRMLGGPYIVDTAGPNNNNGTVDPRDISTFLNSNASDITNYAVYRVAAPDTYTIEIVHVEQAGGSSLEVAWVPGSNTALNNTSAWALLGNPSDPSVPIAAPILPNDLFNALTRASANAWSTRFYYPTSGIGNLGAGITAAQNAATPFMSAEYSWKVAGSAGSLPPQARIRSIKSQLNSSIWVRQASWTMLFH